MKKIIVLLLLITTTFSLYSQVPDTCFTKTQIKNIYNNVRVLEYKDSIYNCLIIKYKDQVTDYEKLRISDSLSINNQKIQIINLEQNNKDLNTINKLTAPKWYKSPIIVASTTFLATFLLITGIK